ncbi:MAG: GMC family oxidoreductase, partial [Planctomycetota bacterium]
EWAKLPFVVLFDLPRVMRYAYFRLSKAKPKIHRARIRNFMEMEPHPGNRVTLSEEKDEHGTRLAFAEHSCTERDRRSMVAIHEALAEDLKRTGLGELEGPLSGDPQPWPIDQDASHHMGTTRMGRDPKTSVVDENLRLHKCQNVWLAGGSVFPSSGCANPTFTLVALSIRLARHLRKELK